MRIDRKRHAAGLLPAVVTDPVEARAFRGRGTSRERLRTQAGPAERPQQDARTSYTASCRAGWRRDDPASDLAFSKEPVDASSASTRIVRWQIQRISLNGADHTAGVIVLLTCEGCFFASGIAAETRVTAPADVCQRPRLFGVGICIDAAPVRQLNARDRPRHHCSTALNPHPLERVRIPAKDMLPGQALHNRIFSDVAHRSRPFPAHTCRAATISCCTASSQNRT